MTPESLSNDEVIARENNPRIVSRAFGLSLLGAIALGLFAFVIVYGTVGLLFYILGINQGFGKPLLWWQYFFVVPAALALYSAVGLVFVGFSGCVLAAVVQLAIMATGAKSPLPYAVAGGIVGCGVVVLHYALRHTEIVQSLRNELTNGVLPAALVAGVIGGGVSWWMLFRYTANWGK